MKTRVSLNCLSIILWMIVKKVTLPNNRDKRQNNANNQNDKTDDRDKRQNNTNAQNDRTDII